MIRLRQSGFTPRMPARDRGAEQTERQRQRHQHPAGEVVLVDERAERPLFTISGAQKP